MSFEITGLQEQVKQLQSLLTSDPDFRKRVHGVIRQVLFAARKEISAHAKGEMDTDPRHAYKAVRLAVYRRILGGQVNILSKRRAGKATGYSKPLKGLPKRGGNRWGRSQRTIDLESYEGSDRGFILRFINAGAHDRAIHSFTGKDGKRHNIKGSGYRGSIEPRNWFGPASQQALEKAALSIQDLIDRIINKEFV